MRYRQVSVTPKSEGSPTNTMPPPQNLPNMAASPPVPLDILTLDMKGLVKKIQDLSHLGIEDSKIALPKICVVGDQSTGKSSLIEGISEIKVPRSAGTCTRCPMEINLSESEPGQPWKCVVYLSRRYWFDPDKKIKNTPKRSEPLGPWQPYEGQDDEVFVTLTDKNLVQNTIFWAQLAILNPSTNSQDYVPGQNSETPFSTQVKFSPNVVRLDISAPNFPALSFYDLPGVISQAEQDDETYLVKLVENLVKKYVSQENCIVLLTLTMTDDATNSSAARIIRDTKGAKERTLGVLTKPDRISGYESFAQWNEILQGQKFGLGHGYYVVRNNPDPEVDHAKARQEEEAFFSDPFWAGQLASYGDRFGVRRLQAALSAVLMEQIQNCLPSITRQIYQKAERIDAELSTLPDPPREDFQQILIEKRAMLGERLKSLFDGGTGYGSSNTLQKFWNHLVVDFQKALAITRPTLRMSSMADTLATVVKIDPDCEMYISPRHKRKAPGLEPKTPDGDSQNSQPAVPSGPDYKMEVFSEWKEPGRRFSLEEVRQIKEDSHRAGIPNQIDPSAIEILNRQSVEHWKAIMKLFIHAAHGLVQKILFETLDEVVAQYQQTGLYRALKTIIINFLAGLRSEYYTSALAHYNVEHEKPFTMAQTHHKRAMQEALEALVRGRHHSRAKSYLKHRGIASDDEHKLNKVTAAELGPDPYSQELEMMASSRGYYEIASSRFLDVICQLAHSKLFTKCQNDLIKAVNAELGANTRERCSELMAEDPERESRRLALTRERAKVAQAREWLTAVNHIKENDEEMGESSGHTLDETQSMVDWSDVDV